MIQKPSPLVSIIISVYNGAATLEKTLDSLYSQTFTDFEIIAVNDGSTDNSKDILASYQNKFPAGKFHILTNNINSGLATSLNNALLRSSGNYIARIDADDAWHSNKLSKQITYALSHPENGVLGTWYFNIKNGKKNAVKLPVKDINIKRAIYRKNPFGHSCVLIKKTLLEKNGGYNQNMRYSQDRELWFRLMPQTKFHNLPDLLVDRNADANLSTTRKTNQILQSISTTAYYIKKNRASVFEYAWLIEPIARYSYYYVREKFKK